jgi:hypothetical protein
MTLPTLLLAGLIALFYGTFYHLVRGGSVWRLLLYLGLSLFGFVMGHLVGLWRNWVFFPIGGMNLGLSSAGSILALILGDWLSRVEVNTQSKV